MSCFLLTSLFTVTCRRNHCYCPSSFWPSWDGGGRQMSKPNPVIGEQAWKHPLLQQMGGGKPAHGSQCSEYLFCYCGIQEGRALMGTVVNRPSAEDLGYAHTWPHGHVYQYKRASAMPAQTPHICGLCPFLFITLSPPEHPGERKIVSTKLCLSHEQHSKCGGTDRGQNFWESKDESKSRDLSPPAYEAKLVWTDVPWNLQTAWLCSRGMWISQTREWNPSTTKLQPTGVTFSFPIRLFGLLLRGLCT